MNRIDLRNTHWKPGKPDEDVLVLCRVTDDEEPIQMGFVDEGRWCDDGGGLMDARVLGWMHLEDAALLLDQPRIAD
jgi:hypothetical protein